MFALQQNEITSSERFPPFLHLQKKSTVRLFPLKIIHLTCANRQPATQIQEGY